MIQTAIQTVCTSVCALALVAGAVLGRAPRTALQESPRASLADLAWLSGTWQGSMSGQQAEETWSTPAAGGMMGMFRLWDAKKVAVYEFLLLEEDQHGLHLRFRHIGPGHRAWEKEGPLEFKLTSAREGLFVFESPNPAQTPTRVTYALPDAGKLIVTVETVREGRTGDSFDVVFTRAE